MSAGRQRLRWLVILNPHHLPWMMKRNRLERLVNDLLRRIRERIDESADLHSLRTKLLILRFRDGIRPNPDYAAELLTQFEGFNAASRRSANNTTFVSPSN